VSSVAATHIPDNFTPHLQADSGGKKKKKRSADEVAHDEGVQTVNSIGFNSKKISDHVGGDV